MSPETRALDALQPGIPPSAGHVASSRGEPGVITQQNCLTDDQLDSIRAQLAHILE